MNNQKPTYIYEIPYCLRKELCRILDFNDSWKPLGGIMKFNTFDIEEIENVSRRNKESPSDILLTKWGHLNHSLDELFVLLFNIKNVPAMQCLKALVPPSFNRLLEDCIASNANNISSNGNEAYMTTDNNPTPSTEQRHVPAFNKNPHVVNHKQDVRIESSDKIVNGPPVAAESSTDISISAGSINYLPGGASGIPWVPYEELAEATNNWHPSNVLGKGGFAEVFKGNWKHTLVAIKKLNPDNVLLKESLRELKHLNSCRHDNVLPLYGYSKKEKMHCLVYMFMDNGSLEDRLKCKNNKPPLTWKQRRSITMGVARGLQFLHTAPIPLIHGDIKPANILLDKHEEPRIGDFGLARKGPQQNDNRTHLDMSRIHGTRLYLPDEFLRGHKLSSAVDTYSYGIVMFEIATTLPIYDKKRSEKFLKDYIVNHVNMELDLALLEDYRIKGSIESNPELCRKIINLGIRCIEQNPARRPTMVHVWKELTNY